MRRLTPQVSKGAHDHYSTALQALKNKKALVPGNAAGVGRGRSLKRGWGDIGGGEEIISKDG